ncbi:MAG: hypothetical protein C4336_07750, partial [Armatimonadota bacterium]
GYSLRAPRLPLTIRRLPAGKASQQTLICIPSNPSTTPHDLKLDIEVRYQETVFGLRLGEGG